MLRKLGALVALSAATFAACGGDGDDSAAGGEAGDTGAAGDTGTGGSSGCAETGEGTIDVEVTGLPSGVDAAVDVEGPAGTDSPTESTTLEERSGGAYTVSAARVTDDDPIVRTVYDPTVSSASFCLVNGKTETVTVAYRAIPSSNKLWTTNANGDHELVGFASALLETTAEVGASVAADVGVGNDVAFDRDGNLWSLGATLAEPPIVRVPAASLGTSGDKEFDRGIAVAGVDCLPAMRAIAFDGDGNLWASVCGDEVVRLDAGDLDADGDVTPSVVLSGVAETGNLAFDAEGNLWVASGGAVARIDAARLDASDADAPDLLLAVTEPDDAANGLGVTDLAFDADGNLWATDFGANAVFAVAEAELGASGEASVPALVRIAIGVTALIDRPAFDESGGLWIGLGGGGVARLSPEQLTVSTDPGDPTSPEFVITSGDLGSVGRVGFYPAAAGLPLFHRLP
jgi:sugar lactone lactonase YvrE